MATFDAIASLLFYATFFITDADYAAMICHAADITSLLRRYAYIFTPRH